MNSGDMFDVREYDLYATIVKFDDGDEFDVEIVVLNNNSDHFLVAERKRSDDVAQLVASFAYAADARSTAVAYAEALRAATAIAFAV